MPRANVVALWFKVWLLAYDRLGLNSHLSTCGSNSGPTTSLSSKGYSIYLCGPLWEFSEIKGYRY